MNKQDEQLLISLDISWKIISREMKTAIEKGLICGEGAHTRMMELTDALRQIDMTIANTVRRGLEAAKGLGEQEKTEEK